MRLPAGLLDRLLAARLRDAGLRFALGYHGTSLAALERIRAEGFRASRNGYDWLGDGVYFWQDGPDRAREWAEERYAEPAVIRALLVWRADQAIDFLDVGWAEAVAELFQVSLDRSGGSAPEQRAGSKRRALDCAMLNAAVGELRAAGRPIRVVRAAFPEDAPIYPGSEITERGHVQIAVRDPAVIKRIWVQRRR